MTGHVTQILQPNVQYLVEHVQKPQQQLKKCLVKILLDLSLTKMAQFSISQLLKIH